MNCVAIVFLAYLAINSGSSSALSGISNSPSRKNYTTEESGTCPMNSSISVKVFRNLRGEWLTTFVARNKLRNLTRSMDLNLEKNILECGDSRYITISGFLKDTETDNFSEATAGDYRNNTDGEAYDSCKRNYKLTSIADDLISINNNKVENANETRKSLHIIEQRMNSFEKTQNNITEILMSFEKTQSSFQKTLTNIEQVLNEMRGILNSTKNLEHEDKENTTTMPSEINCMSSVTEVEEIIATCPPCPAITKAKVQLTFDSAYKGRKVQLSSDLRTATRTKPTEGEYYGGVISKSLLKEDEVFQIRIDETMDKWSYDGIAMCVIKEKNEHIEEKFTICQNNKGTWGIRSRPDSESGKSETWKDAKLITPNGYPLDTRRLPVGTLLGISRTSNGNIHFFVNGVDKGPAFRNVPKNVYACVDVIEYVTKVSITN